MPAAEIVTVSIEDVVRAVVLAGTSRVFCAGQDLAEHAAAPGASPESSFSTLAEHYNPGSGLSATLALNWGLVGRQSPRPAG